MAAHNTQLVRQGQDLDYTEYVTEVTLQVDEMVCLTIHTRKQKELKWLPGFGIVISSVSVVMPMSLQYKVQMDPPKEQMCHMLSSCSHVSTSVGKSQMLPSWEEPVYM